MPISRPIMARGLAILVACSFLAGCAAEEQEAVEAGKLVFTPTPTPDTSVEAEPAEPRVAPEWEQAVSVADFSRCKLQDPRPAWVQELFRGETRDGVIGRENVGFPRTEREVPGLGEGNIILAKVAFNDAPPSDELPDDFLEEQAAILTEWSEFWSQGKFRYEMQVVEGWVTVPVDHVDYEIDPGAGDNQYDQEQFHQEMKSRMTEISELVVDALPDDLDYAAADAVFIYWTPEMYAFKQTISNRGGFFDTPQGRLQIPFQAGGVFHTTDQQLPFEQKKEWAWTYFAHDILHWQGMNGHAPGNGWKTGVGQGAYPADGIYSGALAAWELFLFEWLDDEQVFCADLETLTEPQTVMITPLEVYGGERQMIAIRTVDYKLIVVESRRPVGYSDTWPDSYSGLLVYEVDADGIQTDHLPIDCGNDREKTKWAYYLYPDANSDVTCMTNDIESIIVREGMSVTHSGVRVTLEYSNDETDYVLIERVDDES